jgi:hypothetical protein
VLQALYFCKPFREKVSNYRPKWLAEGEKVRLIGHWDGEEEARWIGEEIESAQSGTRGVRPVSLDEMAISERGDAAPVATVGHMFSESMGGTTPASAALWSVASTPASAHSNCWKKSVFETVPLSSTTIHTSSLAECASGS